MHTFISVLLCLAGAEVVRRCYLSIVCALTGPLSKIPGPFLNRFSGIPWAIQNLTGNSINTTPKMFEKYGDVIRVGTLLTNSLWTELRGVQDQGML
jgi:hypothetical protein